MKKVYIILWETNRPWSTQHEGILGETAYLDKDIAYEMAKIAQDTENTTPTIEQWGADETFNGSFEEYLEYKAWERLYYTITYSVKEMNLF